MDFSLEYYKTFYFVAKYGNMTRAANALFISQPAVSRTIHKLEETLGCKLFQRAVKGIQLTREGEVLFAHVSTAFKELEIGEKKVYRYSEYEAGDLYIGSVESALYLILMNKLPVFHTQFPKISIHVIGRTTMDICNSLKEGSVDVAFVTSPLSDSYEFDTYPVLEFHDIFAANSEYFPELMSGTHDISEIAEYPIITLDKGTNGRAYYEQWFLESGSQLKPTYNVRSSAATIPFVECGLGIGLLPKEYFTIPNYTLAKSSGNLFFVNTSMQIPTRTLYLAVNTKFPMSAACRQFINFIDSEIDV